ncbi:hypothetical protein I302_107107 [Kwoniella bestiolae CBS 10118]|uniref:Uncharacterized protein n=1 Tax=Kwoniella bestiolae CBS 10118 TaxID=1296100 RepID=A0A1B9FZI0_9TREE|nr:hypothetical protein I302_05628 [Kwoniella bestiolae CBS 10118]OCF24169.1 hypothetical protein I302_05628 [Kwoniella bestiolae CBS 10118]
MSSPTPIQEVSSSADEEGLKITFRSAKQLELERGSEKKSTPNSLGSNTSACALHPKDPLPAFIDALPSPPTERLAVPATEVESASAGRITGKVKKD